MMPWLLSCADVFAKPSELQGKNSLSHDVLETLSIEEVVNITQVLRASSIDSLPINTQTKNHCLQHIQMVATSEQTAKKAAQLSYAFHTDERLTALGRCLPPVVWLNNGSLTCNYDAAVGRASCQLDLLKPWLEKTQISHLVLLVEQSKAYTYQGIMYLDEKDDYDVFVHELAHFAGFMDEYALSEASAKLYCDDLNAVNVISLDEWNASSGIARLWRKHGESFKVTDSMTCNAVGKKTVKPSDKLTFLEYHDTAHIPELYLHLWRYQLEREHQFNLMRLRLGLPLLLSSSRADHSSVRPTSE